MPEGTNQGASEREGVKERVIISASAAERIAALRRTEGNEALMLRIGISGGGCSGFQYNFSLDDKVADDDRVFEQAGVKVVIDETSLALMEGARVTYVNDLVGSFFAVENPNATSSCGCGTSFAI